MAEGRQTGIHLFVYGTLVDQRTLDEVLGYRFAGERLRARLVDYQRLELDTFDYRLIVARAGHSVDGILITDLSPHDLVVLDRYEGVECGNYSRASVDVEVWGCGPRPLVVGAQAYVAGPNVSRLMASASETTPSSAT
jgi:gamma-glutamylcyclotransferase (GGCT)/AIG2-like uncharacterized protein YtfP